MELESHIRDQTFFYSTFFQLFVIKNLGLDWIRIQQSLATDRTRTQWIWIRTTLQMKGQWISNINVWFLFPKQNYCIMFCLPVPVFLHSYCISVRDLYISRTVCLFWCSQICGSILGIYCILYKSLTDTWLWKLGLRPRNSQKRNT